MGPNDIHSKNFLNISSWEESKIYRFGETWQWWANFNFWVYCLFKQTSVDFGEEEDEKIFFVVYIICEEGFGFDIYHVRTLGPE